MSRSQRHMREVYEGGTAQDSANDTFVRNQTRNPPVAAATRATNEQTVGSYRTTDNAPAVANALVNQTATAGNAFSYQFASNTFSDSDSGGGDTLTYTALEAVTHKAIPAWLTFTPGTRTFAGTPAAKDKGVKWIRVYATDRAAKQVYSDFKITVS